MKIIIGGAMGRMGRELANIAANAGVETVCGVDVAAGQTPMAFPVVREYADITVSADVLIDFSRAEGLNRLLTYAQAAGMSESIIVLSEDAFLSRNARLLSPL